MIRAKFGATYILPIRLQACQPESDLASYLAWLSQRLEVIVVDGSALDVFLENDVLWPSVSHIQPRSDLITPNGKVGGVLSGLELAAHDRIVIGDDDVRYDDDSLARVIALLDEYDLVRPQNYFRPLPWHALWDTGRSLLNRASGGDWPGTLALRRSALARTQGYAGDVLFENLELVRTIKSAGGHERIAMDIFVKRNPPAVTQFWSQRARQAYDEFARPWRLLLQLTWLPLQIGLLAQRPKALALLYLGIVALAELGRRKAGGSGVFPLAASLAAPVWFMERSICAWLAVSFKFTRGGIRYRDGILRKAASSSLELDARLSSKGAALNE